LDYFLTSDRILNKVKTAEIHNDIFGSDHCPVSITLE
jgi:exodeoxyribonuclease-3